MAGEIIPEPRATSVAISRLTLEKFVGLPHLAVTRDVGTVDDALAKQGLERRVAVDVPFYAIVPHMIEGSRLLAVIGERVGHGLTATTNVRCYPLPFTVEPWNVSAAWPRQDTPPISWLVTVIRQASALLA
jgi:DNA-binding transcriptional LysR family regulator